MAITFLKDLKQLFMSEENMMALLSIDVGFFLNSPSFLICSAEFSLSFLFSLFRCFQGWQLKLLNFLKISAAALERRKEDEEARIKKIESKPLPDGWEIKYEKLSGRRCSNFFILSQLFSRCIQGVSNIPFILPGSFCRYFTDHKNRKTSWNDPRFGPKDPHFLSYEDPIVEVVFDILIAAFSVTFKQQKDCWKLWEEAFGNIRHFLGFPLSFHDYISFRSLPFRGGRGVLPLWGEGPEESVLTAVGAHNLSV